MVFENILVRLLNQKLGHYIEGFDSKNLEVGIFSGNIIIENVKLKPTVPELLDLPFDLKFSHIKKLVLKIPFTNLSGAPVEIELDGLYALFDVQREVDWMQDVQSIKTKLENIDQYAQDMIEKMIQVQEKQLEVKEKSAGQTKQESQKTYAERLIVKILDNIQLRISNIHIRVENQIGFKASFGICLQSIGMFTVNERDELIFVDRTKKSNQNVQMIKKLDLNNLGVYINPNEQRFLTLKSFEEIQLNMTYSIMKTGQTTNNLINYLFAINLSIRLVQNPKGDFRIPEYIIVADICKLNITLEQDQLQHIISIFEYLNSYKKHLNKLRESQCSKDERMISSYMKSFQEIFPIYFYKHERNLDSLSSEKKREFLEAIEKLPLKNLFDVAKLITAEELKNQQIKQINTKNQGIFGKFFRSSKKKNSIITQKDTEKIQTFFESLIRQEDSMIEEQATKSGAPDDYVWLKIKFQFEGGCIYLKKQFNPSEYKGASFSFLDLKGVLNVKIKGNSVNASLREMNVDIVEELILRSQKKITNVLGKSAYSQERNIIFFRLDTKEIGENKNERSIKFNLAQAKLSYNTLLIELLSDFFEVKVSDKELRDQTLKKIEELQEKTQQQVENSFKNIDKYQDILKLDVFLASPIIVIPFLTAENVVSQDCIALQLGNLCIRTDSSIDDGKKGQEHECFFISLQNINCRYFTSIENMENYLSQKIYTTQQISLAASTRQFVSPQINPAFDRSSIFQSSEKMRETGDMFTIIHEFSINIKIDIQKSSQNTEISKKIPKIAIEGDLSSLKVSVNSNVYLKLLSLNEVFAPSNTLKTKKFQLNSEEYEKHHIEEVLTEKKELLKKSIKVGFLYKRGKHIKKWEKYYGVLTRDHIYFFEIQNSLKPISHVTIKYASIFSVDEDQCGFKNAFIVRNRNEDIYLGCEKQDNTEKWIQLIQKIHEENLEEKKLYEIQLSEIEQAMHTEIDTKKIDFDSVELLLNFSINSLDISLEDPEQKVIAELNIQQFTLKAEKRPASMEIYLKLDNLFLNDYIYKYANPSLSHFLSSGNESNSKLINITIYQIDKHHPKYLNNDIFFDCEFGSLFINFKPDTVMAIMDFFQLNSEVQIIKSLELQKEESIRREEQRKKMESMQQENDLLANISEKNQNEKEKEVGNNLLSGEDIVLVKAKVNVRQIMLNLVHRKTKLIQNQINFQSTQIEFTQKSDEMNIGGSLQNLQIFDLTNYPNTIYKEEEYMFQRKQEIVGLWYDSEELLSHINEEMPNIQDKKANLLNFTVTLYDMTSKKIDPKTRESIFVQAFLNSIHIDFIMQPTMRLVDYIMVQVVGIVTAPEGFREDSRIAVSKLIDQKNQIQKDLEKIMQKERITQLQKEVIQSEVLNPLNMNLSVQIKSPVIDVKQSRDASNFIRLYLGTSKITNKRSSCPSRHICSMKRIENNPPIFEDEYQILIEDMKIVIVKDEEYLDVCKRFDFNLKIQMLSFFKELSLCFPGQYFNNSIIIESYISPILLKFSNFDYNIIMAGVFHNISFDDGLDQFYIHDFWANFEEKQKLIDQKGHKSKHPTDQFQQTHESPIKMKNSQKSFEFKDILISKDEVEYQHENGIIFCLDFQNITIFAINNKSIPFSKITFDQARFIYNSTEEKNRMKIVCKYIDGSYFEKDELNDIFYEYPLIGSLVKFNIHNQEQIKDLEHLTQQLNQFRNPSKQNKTNSGFNEGKLRERLFSIPNFILPDELKSIDRQNSGYSHIERQQSIDSSKKNNFQTKNSSLNSIEFNYLNNDKTGEKEIILNLNNITIVAQMGILLQIAGFTNLDEETELVMQPVLPIPQLQEPQQKGTLQNDDLLLEYSEQNIEINVFNILICSPCLESGNILTLRGQFEIMVSSKSAKSLDELKLMIREQKIAREELNQTNVIQQMDVIVDGLEVFICDYNELTHKDFLTVKKREILLPLKINLNSKTFLTLNEDHSQSIEKKLLDLSINQSSLRISFQDINLISDVVNYANTQIEIYKEQSNQIESAKQSKLKEKTPVQNQMQVSKGNSAININQQNSNQPGNQQKQNITLILNQSQSRTILKNKSTNKLEASNQFQDIDLLQKNMSTSQINEKKEAVQREKQLKKEDSINQLLSASASRAKLDQSQQKSTQLEIMKDNLKEMKLSMVLEGFQIVIINDVGNAFTPVLDLMFYDLATNFTSNLIMDKMNTQIHLGINYFNPKVSEWEPIIERIGLEVNYLRNELGEAKEVITFEPISEHFKCLQINVSSQFIFILSKTVNQFNQEIILHQKEQFSYNMDSPRMTEKPRVVHSESHSKNVEDKTQPIGDQKGIFQLHSQPTQIPNENRKYQNLMKKSMMLSRQIHNWEKQRFTLLQQNATHNQNPQLTQILENVSHVSPYTVQNFVGHEIEIVSDFSFKQDIQSMTTKATTCLADNCSTTFRVESKLDHFLLANNRAMQSPKHLSRSESTTLCRPNKVRAFIKTEIFKLSSIKNIDLDKVRSQEIFLKRSDEDQSPQVGATDSFKKQMAVVQKRGQQQIQNLSIRSSSMAQAPLTGLQQKEKFRVNTEVKLDFNLNRKILILSSPYVLFNNTQIDLEITLTYKKYTKSIIIKSQSQQGIPIDFLYSNMQISILNTISEDNIFNQKKITTSDKSPQLNVEECTKLFNQNIELKIGERYLLMKVTQDAVNRYKTIMTFTPPYRFKNCLPKPLRLQLISSNKYTTVDRKIFPDEEFEEFDYPLQNKTYIKIQLEGFFWSDEYILNGVDSLSKIKIADSYNQSIIQVHQVASTEMNSSKNYYFYCKALLINETEHNLEFYTKNDSKWNSKPILVGGQFPIYQGERIDDNLVLLGEETGNVMIIYDKKCKQKQSKEVAISGVGSTEIQVKTKMEMINQQVQSVLIPIGIQVSLKEIEPKVQLFTKVITLSPRIVLVNDTEFTIYAKQFQTSSNQSGMALESMSRKPIFWMDNCKQILQVGYHQQDIFLLNSPNVEEESGFSGQQKRQSLEDFTDMEVLWSCGIDPSNLGVMSMCIRDKKNMIVKFVRVDIRSDNSNIFMIVQEVSENQVPYQIINKCPDISIDIPVIPAHIQPNEKAYFAWDEPLVNKNERELQLIIRPKDGAMYSDKLIFLKPDTINCSEKIIVAGKKIQPRIIEDINIKYSIMIDGFTKVIVFENCEKGELVTTKEKVEFSKQTSKDIQRLQNMNLNPNQFNSLTNTLQNQKIQRFVSVSLKKIGISIIQNHSLTMRSNELFYIYMQNTELILIEKQDSIIFQFKVKFLNLDNNSTHLVNFPVVLTPSRFSNHSSEGNSKAFFNLLVEKNTCAKNMNLFNSIILDIEPLTLKVEEEFISVILEFVEQIKEGIEQVDDSKSNQNMKDIVKKSYASSIITRQSLFSNQEQFLPEKKTFLWESKILPESSVPTYIDQIILSPISLNVSFKSKSRTTEDNFSLLKIIATALGVALINIDDAPLTLKGIRLSNCFDTMDGIIDKLVVKYKEQAMREVFHILGSLNIIGNPIGFFNNISSGVQDFIDKPIEGLVQGPLEGGMGFALGTASLVKNIMAGTFNSVNKFTGSFSTGLAHLCFDEDFMKQREKMRLKKPKHILDGIEFGLTSIVNGVGRGVIDVFAKPIQGANDAGIKGLMKGTWQGISGFFIKPMTGILDAASKAAEGITNTATYFDDKPNSRRIRQIRPFYGLEQYFKEYNDIDAEMHTEIQRIQSGIFKNSIFLSAFILLDDELNQKGLVLLLEAVLLIEIRTRKIVWIISANQFKSCQQTFEGINIFINEDNAYLQERKAFVPVKNPNYSQYIYEKLQSYMNLLTEH